MNPYRRNEEGGDKHQWTPQRDLKELPEYRTVIFQ